MFYNLTKNYNNLINSIRTNIINGPFIGMKYISESVGSCHMPKILGIYENEIMINQTQEIVDELLSMISELSDEEKKITTDFYQLNKQ